MEDHEPKSLVKIKPAVYCLNPTVLILSLGCPDQPGPPSNPFRLNFPCAC
ncbi:hypothetical protein DsansV1_C46g0242451 [Dioscorea sansibarensis]